MGEVLKPSNNTKEWSEVEGELGKKFKFSNYKLVMEFVNDVMNIAQNQNHHPRIVVNYDTVEIYITDHEAGKISDKCYKFIESVNALS